MNNEFQLKVQAYLDGELPAGEAAELARRLETDPEARALAAELKNTHAAVAGHEEGLKLPETREFFWSKIEREIERQEAAAARPARQTSWKRWFWRALIPVGGLAVACLIYFRSPASGDAAEFAPELEVANDDMGAYTFRDQQSGLTMIWLYNKSSDAQLSRPVSLASAMP